MNLSVIMITKNDFDLIKSTLESITNLYDELLVADEKYSPMMKDLIEKHGGKYHVMTKNFGIRKQNLINKSKCNWILLLDSDERVSKKLYNEIKKIVKPNSLYNKLLIKNNINGFNIPYQNYFFGQPIFSGGESYSKVRLFKRRFGRITRLNIHEEVVIEGRIENLNGKIDHYSYRTPVQLLKKFTLYAILESKNKYKNKEEISLKKLFLYAPHMFIARFINEKGYNDGWRGFLLSLYFSYLELMTYWLLFYLILKNF